MVEVTKPKKKSLQNLIEDAGYTHYGFNPLAFSARGWLAVEPGPSQAAFFMDLLQSAQDLNMNISEFQEIVETPMRESKTVRTSSWNVKSDSTSEQTVLYFPGVEFQE